MHNLYYFVLIPMVYFAVGVFVIGTGARLIALMKAPPNPTSLAIYPLKKPGWLWAVIDTFTFPTVRRHKPLLWIALIVFHVALLLLLLGHIELIAPIAALAFIPHYIFIGGGWLGVILSVTILFFLFRRFHSPVKELSVAEDYLLLILLFLTIVFGSQMNWARNWLDYDSIGVGSYSTYLMGLLHFRPVLPMEIEGAGHGFMLVLHVFFANLVLIFFPFSQLMHSILALPANKLRRGGTHG